MKRLAISLVVYLAANAIGLLIAVLLLPGFQIAPMAFIIAVLIFSLVQMLANPVVSGIAKRAMPQLMGGISLVVIFLGLFLTAMLVSGMEIGGISNWLAATLLVWLGSLIAGSALRAMSSAKGMGTSAGRPKAPRHTPRTR